MKKEQYFHFRRDKDYPELLIPASPQADAKGGICIYALPIPEENIILWGIAKCHENDNYVKAKARMIASGRAISNQVRVALGKPEIPNIHGTVSPFMDYDKATRMAVKIANKLHEIGFSDFQFLNIDWENESINYNTFPFPIHFR